MRQFVISACVGFVLFFTSAAVCQQDTMPKQNQEQQSPAKQDWKEAWRNATIAFGEIAHDQTLNLDYFHAIGTGIIISTDVHTAYVVTARHMFCDSDKHFHPAQLRVRYAWQDHKSIYSYLGVPFTLRSSSGESAAAILGHITPRKRDAAEGN